MEKLDTHRYTQRQTHSQTNIEVITHAHTCSHRHISHRNRQRKRYTPIPTESHTQDRETPTKTDRDKHRHTQACTSQGESEGEERKDLYEGSHSTQSTLTLVLWQHHNWLQDEMSPSKLVETRQNSWEIVDIASIGFYFLRNNVRIWSVKWW